jgi:hypothetical protein
MLPPLLAALRFRCNNTAYRPVMQALELLARYTGVDGKTRFFADTDTVPIDGVVPRAWRDAVVDDRGRVERIPYELCGPRSSARRTRSRPATATCRTN